MSVSNITTIIADILNQIHDNETQEERTTRLANELAAIGISGGKIVNPFKYAEILETHKWARVTTAARFDYYDSHCRTAEREWAKVAKVLEDQDASKAWSLIATLTSLNTAASADWVKAIAKREMERGVCNYGADAMRTQINKMQEQLKQLHTLADIPVANYFITQYEEVLSWIK